MRRCRHETEEKDIGCSKAALSSIAFGHRYPCIATRKHARHNNFTVLNLSHSETVLPIATYKDRHKAAFTSAVPVTAFYQTYKEWCHPRREQILTHLRIAHRGCGALGNVPTLHPSLPHCTHSEPELYWEPQSDLHCLVHAYNMLQGGKLFVGKAPDP
jgi:hypothetical protein